MSCMPTYHYTDWTTMQTQCTHVKTGTHLRCMCEGDQAHPSCKSTAVSCPSAALCMRVPVCVCVWVCVCVCLCRAR